MVTESNSLLFWTLLSCSLLNNNFYYKWKTDVFLNVYMFLILRTSNTTILLFVKIYNIMILQILPALHLTYNTYDIPPASEVYYSVIPRGRPPCFIFYSIYKAWGNKRLLISYFSWLYTTDHQNHIIYHSIFTHTVLSLLHSYLTEYQMGSSRHTKLFMT